VNLDAALRIKANVQGENNIRRLGNSMQGLEGRVKNTAMTVRGLTTAMRALGGVIAGTAIVAGFTGMIRKGLEAGDALDKLSARTGVATTSLIGLQNAANLSDVSAKGLESGLTKLNVKIDQAARGNAQAGQAFRRLGIDIKNTDGTLKSADEVFKSIGDRFADLPDGAQKAAAAVDIFGKAGAELIPMLNGGRAAMEEFNYEVSDEFAARSALFNDTITKIGFKAEGFQLQLTDALLPALQGILEAFQDLFSTDNDWTALFEVIKGGLRVVASAIMATVALVDQLVKATVNGFMAIKLAIQGDFEGAGRALQAGVQQAIDTDAAYRRRFAQIFTDAAPPTARSAGLSGLTEPDAVARGGGRAPGRSSAAGANAAAREAQRAQENYNRALEGAAALADDLNRKNRDLTLSTKALGATGAVAIELEYAAAMNAAGDEAEDLAKKVFNLIQLTGNAVQFEGLQNLARDYEKLRVNQVDVRRQQQITELTERQNRVFEDLAIQAGVITGEKLKELQINRQIDEVLRQFPDLTQEQIEKVKELTGAAAEGVDTFKQKLKDYKESVDDLRGQLADALINTFQGLEDKLTQFVTTGKANFKDLARSILEDLARIAIRQAIIAPLVGGIGGIFGFARGGVMTEGGPLPLRGYARGGIANSPQLALFGEGSQPEAYVPLPDGRRIPVALQGTAGAAGGANVTVNVDARGTDAQGNSDQSRQLGRVIAAAVQNELIKQRRPGGILAA
jgi:lambda family phage tail tape measure protein